MDTWGDKAKQMLKDGKLKTPFRSDAEEKGYPEGSVYITVRTAQRPGVVSLVPDKNGKP